LFVPEELPVPARRVVFPPGMASAPTKAVAATNRVVKETMICDIEKGGEYLTLLGVVRCGGLVTLGVVDSAL
jgi:hypothetical protein